MIDDDDRYTPDVFTIAPSLEQVQQRFESWRQHRKKRTRIPQTLWKAAAALSQEYSICHLSKALRVNYTTLKKQVVKFSTPQTSTAYVSSSTFVELAPPVSPIVQESTIEMIKRDGAVMRSDPFSGAVFVFRNKKATALKILAYDGQGFWLCQKRLSKG